MKFDFDSQYFNIEQTLDCGQIFRFFKTDDGFTVYSAGHICRLIEGKGKITLISDDSDYFFNFFDLGRDYAPIIEQATAFDIPLLKKAAQQYKGLRLLNQDKEEMIYSFLISQNNNIPRIKSIISNICRGLGTKCRFENEEYFAFPTTSQMVAGEISFFKSCGAGYRDSYLFETSHEILKNGIAHLQKLSTPELKKALMSYKGVGGKVADCISLFGFSRHDSFPVDTWIEKVYREDFGGTLENREKISEFFQNTFKDISGYVQQYLFYGKRQEL